MFQDMGVSPEPGISAERDPEVHKQGARKLQPAFSPRAVRAYEPTIHKHVDAFISQVREHGTSDSGMDVSRWFDFLAWDLAGDLTYGRDFRHVRDGELPDRGRVESRSRLTDFLL